MPKKPGSSRPAKRYASTRKPSSARPASTRRTSSSDPALQQLKAVTGYKGNMQDMFGPIGRGRNR